MAGWVGKKVQEGGGQSHELRLDECPIIGAHRGGDNDVGGSRDLEGHQPKQGSSKNGSKKDLMKRLADGMAASNCFFDVGRGNVGRGGNCG